MKKIKTVKRLVILPVGVYLLISLEDGLIINQKEII